MIISRTGLISKILDQVSGVKKPKAAQGFALEAICSTSAQEAFGRDAKGRWNTFRHWYRIFASGDNSVGLLVAVFGLVFVKMEGV
jgi:hypothetical protein